MSLTRFSSIIFRNDTDREEVNRLGALALAVALVNRLGTLALALAVVFFFTVLPSLTLTFVERETGLPFDFWKAQTTPP